jgi:hypothetical protein
VKRLLGGVYARQAAYKLRLKTLGEHWRQLTFEEQRYIRELLTPEEWADMHLVDRASRGLIEARDNGWTWPRFILQLERDRKARLRR